MRRKGQGSEKGLGEVGRKYGYVVLVFVQDLGQVSRSVSKTCVRIGLNTLVTLLAA